MPASDIGVNVTIGNVTIGDYEYLVFGRSNTYTGTDQPWVPDRWVVGDWGWASFPAETCGARTIVHEIVEEW